MKPILWTAPLFVLSLLASSCASLPLLPTGSPLEGRIDTILRRHHRVTIGVAYYHLGTGMELYRNEVIPFHAASTMKVPLMMALYRAVDRGEMRLDQPIPIRNEFTSIVDGSTFTLDPAEDGDPDLYKAIGSTRPLDELIRRMITRSSNLATNLLIERIGASRVMDLMREVGAYHMQILRGVEDEKAFVSGLNNHTTVKDLAAAFRSLVAGEAFPPAFRADMIEILKSQEFNEKIPAQLPKGTPIAHKTGDITGVHHDAAVVFPPGEKPYVLVVLTEGFLDENEANRTIAEISRAVWEHRSSVPEVPEENHGRSGDESR